MAVLYKRGRVWWCTFRGYDGLRRQRSTQMRDRRLAHRVACHWENQHAFAAAGIIDAADLDLAEKGPVKVAMVRAEFLKTIQSDQARADMTRILAKFDDHSGIALANVWGTATVVAKGYSFLRAVQDTGVQTRRVNDHLKALQQFSRFAFQCGYTKVDQLAKLKRQSATADETVWSHGAFTPAQFEGLSAGDNGLYYAFRTWTGIRGSEVARMVRGDLNFETPATVHVRREVSKNRLECTLPLAPALARRLFAELGMRHAGAPLFPAIPLRRETARAWLSRDLKAAGLSPATFNSRSFRRTFVTWMEAAGVELGARQKLRRDRGKGSDRLTVWTYSDSTQVIQPLCDALAATERWHAAQLVAVVGATA